MRLRILISLLAVTPLVGSCDKGTDAAADTSGETITEGGHWGAPPPDQDGSHRRGQNSRTQGPWVSVGNAKFEFDCGEGDSEDYVEIYPSNIIDVAESYYFADLGGLITRFQTIPFDKYSMALFFEVFEQQGGLKWAETVYDPGTGTGALSFAALAQGAQSVVATELDPLAAENARYNARQLGVEDRMEVRLVSFDDQGAWSVVRPDERFDLVVCDPPQGYVLDQSRQFPEIDQPMEKPREVFYTADIGFCFLSSLIEGLDDHLSDDGKAWIAMKIPEGKEMLIQLAKDHGLDARPIFDAQENQLGAGKRRIGERARAIDLSTKAVIYELTRAQP